VTNGLLGCKLGMTQVFNAERVLVPVTVLEVWSGKVVQLKSADRDGYDAVQLGFQEIAERRSNKPKLGHFKRHESVPFRYLREFKKEGDVEPGQVLTVDMFSAGEKIDVIGTSKGKGFQGVMKRHNFAGGPAGHGSMFHRAPGSMGASSYPSRVWKNQRLPGHMGDKRVTAQGINIVEVRPDVNLIFVRGSVPGAIGGQVLIRKRTQRPKS
jgi:large subunit ribosomal protein L3